MIRFRRSDHVVMDDEQRIVSMAKDVEMQSGAAALDQQVGVATVTFVI